LWALQSLAELLVADGDHEATIAIDVVDGLVGLNQHAEVVATLNQEGDVEGQVGCGEEVNIKIFLRLDELVGIDTEGEVYSVPIFILGSVDDGKMIGGTVIRNDLLALFDEEGRGGMGVGWGGDRDEAVLRLGRQRKEEKSHQEEGEAKMGGNGMVITGVYHGDKYQ
jgi:hypothetical protein